MSGWVFRWLTVLFAGLLLSLASPGSAQARWLKAEGTGFIVYSNGHEGELLAFTRRLETLDKLLRGMHRLPVGEAPPRKLPVYLVRNHANLKLVVHSARPTVAGMYIPGEEDIFAVAMRGEDNVLLHEYVHHFMLQNFPTAYPAWVVEGFAEFYSTMRVQGDRLIWGEYDPNRAYFLNNMSWIGAETMLRGRVPGGGASGEAVSLFYAQSWLITHWFIMQPERYRQLGAYLDAVAAGSDPVQALKTATGMTPEQLEVALKAYIRKPHMSRVNRMSDFAVPEPRITTLPASADDLLLLAQRLKVGVPQDERANTAELVRRAAAKHPNDPFARLTLGHAELHFGDRAKGVQILKDLVRDDPDNVEALQWLADDRMRVAIDSDSDAERETIMRQARAFLVPAYQADDANYRTYLLLAISRQTARDYPTDNDIATWRLAFTLAPQLGSVRMGAAQAFMEKGDFGGAIGLLEPLANDPHDSGYRETARKMLERARAGEAPERIYWGLARDGDMGADEDEKQKDPPGS